MSELKFKTIKSGLNKSGKPYFIYRIQGGVWLDYVKEYDAYYMKFPTEVAAAIKVQISMTFGGKSFLGKELKMIQDKPREVNGITYTNCSMGVKVYELREQLGEKTSYLADVAIMFVEYEFGSKKGIRKQLVQFVKAEKPTTNLLAQDDYFTDMQGESSAQVSSNDLEQPALTEDNALPF